MPTWIISNSTHSPSNSVHLLWSISKDWYQVKSLGEGYFHSYSRGLVRQKTNYANLSSWFCGLKNKNESSKDKKPSNILFYKKILLLSHLQMSFTANLFLSCHLECDFSITWIPMSVPGDVPLHSMVISGWHPIVDWIFLATSRGSSLSTKTVWVAPIFIAKSKRFCVRPKMCENPRRCCY